MQTKILDFALSYVGTKESPANSNRTNFGEWFGLNGVAWCGIFASFCYSKAGYALGAMDYLKGFAGVPFALKMFTKRGEVITAAQAQPGDLVIFDWDGNNVPDHVGIFKAHKDATHFETVEGNTAVGNDSNGGEVMLCTRAYDLGKGKIYFIHPKVLDKPAPTAV